MMNCKIQESNIRQDSSLLDMLSSKLSLTDSPDEWQGESEDKEKRGLAGFTWFSIHTRHRDKIGLTDSRDRCLACACLPEQ